MGSIFLFSNNDNEISSIRELLKSEYTVKVFCEEKFLFSNLNSNKIPDIIIIEDSSIDEKIFQYIISKLKTTDKFKNIPIINIFNSDDKDRIKKYTDLGLENIFLKPYNESELSDKIKNIMLKIKKASRRLPQIFLYTIYENLVTQIVSGSNNKFKIDSFSDSKIFVKEIHEQHPDIIIIDDDQNSETTSVIISNIKSKQDFEDVPVILISDCSEKNEISICINLGIDTFLVKPFITEILFHKINNILEEKKENEISTFSIERRKKELMNELNFLPPVPSNFVRILSVISDKNSSAADLEKYIESDKALFQKMIKISNSSFYRAGSSSSEVETSRQSIMTLGFNMIEALTLVTGTNKLFPKRMLSYGYVNEGLWHHSLACSVIAKSIAVDMHLSKYRVDDLFLCGLFHDIGKTILGKYLAFKDKIFLFPELGENNKSQMEKNFTGYSHAEIGEMLIKNWKLPAIVEYTTKNHHQPFLSLTYAKEICIINLADYVANYLKIGFHYRNTYKPVLLDTVKRTLEIDENYVETLIKRSITLYKDISSMFTKIR